MAGDVADAADGDADFFIELARHGFLDALARLDEPGQRREPPRRKARLAAEQQAQARLAGLRGSGRSAAGATLVVKAVESTARGTVYVLERVSDGVRISVQVAGTVAGAGSVAVGTAVTVSVITAGTVLSVAGQVIAFVPNAVGQALLYNRRVGN